ncbi:MAG: hypothetical protein ABIH03_11395 [Pseudomonadota bacterium]
MKPLCIELFAGMFGWGVGFVAEGYRVIGFDIVHEDFHGPVPEGCRLVLQNVLTLDGRKFKDAECIVGSPPCQAYSYMAMPWKRGKAKASEIRADKSGAKLAELNALFDACFRIQREASEAAGHHIPLIVENVRGAQPWVGRAQEHYGSYFLWGNVPALMPIARHGAAVKGLNVPGIKLSQVGFNVAAAQRYREGTKNGKDWFGSGENCSLQRRASSRSDSRKAASAMIAKIPFSLARHIARVYKPTQQLIEVPGAKR